MSDSLQIFLRVKPSSTHSFPSPFHFPTPKTLLIPPNRLYPFDYIFPSSSSLSSLFHQTAEPLLQSFLSGYNATYFVFGQTGTGKTHTMGLLNKLSVESSGIVPETLRLLFIKLEDLVAPNSLKLEDSNSKQKNNPKSRNKPELYMTFFQIYKDEVRDLLNPEAKGLLIREIKDKNETYIQDLVETKVESLDTTIRLINAGLIFRKMGSQVKEKCFLS